MSQHRQPLPVPLPDAQPTCGHPPPQLKSLYGPAVMVPWHVMPPPGDQVTAAPTPQVPPIEKSEAWFMHTTWPGSHVPVLPLSEHTHHQGKPLPDPLPDPHGQDVPG